MTTPSTTSVEDEVLELLRAVPEPCALLMGGDRTIVGMGLVGSIDVHDRHVAVTLVLTDTSCVHFRGMRDYITDVITAHADFDTVDVRMSTTILWTPDRVVHA